MITAKMIYDAIDHGLLPGDYLRNNLRDDDTSFSSVCVDGDVDCAKIAQFLNELLETAVGRR